MDEAKEEIRARLPIEDVVGRYVELKRAGRSLKGRSPWGVDKNPSFMVSPEKGIWHDFSANKGGDIFAFVMEVEGITFKEAFEKLAAQAGVDLAQYRGGDARIVQRKIRAREALELTCKYYQVCLSRNKGVCEYVFYQRNMDRKTVKNFRVGYAPKIAKALVEFLEKKGFNKSEMKDAGLLNRFDGDIFHGRMTIPFIDTTGRVIGFTARVLDKSEPKYLNTPDTLIFNKSRFIFGLAQAKEAIRRNGFVVIVEGNMDVISSHQAGVAEAVATSGTAMTEYHLKALSRLTSDIRLAYDGDEAGVHATERAIMMAGDLGIFLSVISDYQGAKDPDELIQKDPKLWQKAVQDKRPALEWLLEKYEEKVDLSTGEGKRVYSDIAMKIINYIQDSVERKHYEQLVANKLDVSVRDLREKKLKFRDTKKILRKAKDLQPSKKITIVENNLLAIILFGGVSTDIDIEPPEDETKIAELEMIFEEKYKGWSKKHLEKEVQALEASRKNEFKKQRLAELEMELSKVQDDEEAEKKILRQIMKLQKGK